MSPLEKSPRCHLPLEGPSTWDTDSFGTKLTLVPVSPSPVDPTDQHKPRRHGALEDVIIIICRMKVERPYSAFPPSCGVRPFYRTPHEGGKAIVSESQSTPKAHVEHLQPAGQARSRAKNARCKTFHINAFCLVGAFDFIVVTI